MKTPALPPGQLIQRPFIYGLMTCSVALLMREAFLTEEIRYISNWTAFLVLFVLGAGALVFYTRHPAYLASIKRLLPASLIFGLGAGLAIGLSSYLTTTVYEPDYLEKALAASYKSWAASGYSKEAIAGQRELAEAFQDPLKNGLTLGLFYLLVTTSLSFIMGCLSRKISLSHHNSPDHHFLPHR